MNKYLNRGVSTPLAIGIIVVVAVLAGAGVLGYQYYYIPKQEANVENVQDETADWKTYTNTQYGYEIKYPSDYKSQEIPTDSPTGLSINLPRGEATVHEINNAIININLPDDCMFSSNALEDKNMLSFIETKQINGINFYYYKNYLSQQKYLGAYCGMSSGCQSRDVYRTLYKGKCYEMAYNRSDRVFSSVDNYRIATQEEMNVPEVFDQIISTFKFTK